MPKDVKSELLAKLKRDGFDRCEPVRGTPQIRVGCSGCRPAVVGGVPRHEEGCRRAARLRQRK